MMTIPSTGALFYLWIQKSPPIFFQNGPSPPIKWKRRHTTCSEQVKSRQRIIISTPFPDGEKRIPVTPEQEEDFKKLEKLGGWGYAAADLKRRKISLSQETLTAVDDDDTEADFFEIDEDPVLNLAQPPIMLTSRLVRI